MANTLLTIDMVTREASRLLENELVVTKNANRQYDDAFAKSGAKIGDTLRCRLPNRQVVTDGATLVVQPVQQQYAPLTCSSQKHIGIAFGQAERTMKLDDFSKNILQPCISQLAATIDADVAQGVIKYIGNLVGTVGVTPASSQVLLAGMQKLDEIGCPRSDRYATINPAANAALVEGLKGLFNPGGVISKQFNSAMVGENILGYKAIEMSQSIGTFTTGDRTSGTTSAAVTTQGQTTIPVTGCGNAKTIKAGDVFTVGGCYTVNWQTRRSTGSLFQFVALADTVLDGAGAGNVTVAAIYSADALTVGAQALATVNTLPATGQAVTFVGAASTDVPTNLIYHKDAVAFVTADLELPDAGAVASRVVHNGISMVMTEGFDIVNYRKICRLDVLYGYGVIRPELAVRLVG